MQLVRCHARQLLEEAGLGESSNGLKGLVRMGLGAGAGGCLRQFVGAGKTGMLLHARVACGRVWRQRVGLVLDTGVWICGCVDMCVCVRARARALACCL